MVFTNPVTNNELTCHTQSVYILKYSNITVTPYHWVAETMHAAFSMYTCSMSILSGQIFWPTL